MGVLIVAADFTYSYAVPQSISNDLEQFITDNEETILIDLMGAVFYAAFKADLTAKVPVTAKFLAIYNAFNEDFQNTIVKSKGMKEMLKGFIFFDFMRQIKYKNTTMGQVVNSADTSQNVSPGSLYKYLNEAVDTYNAIQLYIRSIAPEDYITPVFNGGKKEIAIPFF
ncbi:MAG: hypothetical protein V4547_18900 [Bacteroidota bacterium]